MKIMIGEFRQESNSFNPVVSTMDFWEKVGIYRGEEVFQQLGHQPCAVGGMIHAVLESEYPIELVYGITMSCQSGGPADQTVMDYFLEEMKKSIEREQPVDGVFLSLHGALVTTQYDDAEGVIAQTIRSWIGEQAVLAVSTDLHAYISDKLVQNVDIICGYHTYPHVDYYETGLRTARLGLLCLYEEIKPCLVKVRIPMIVSAASYSTLSGPFQKLMKYGEELTEQNKILDYSIYQMQPWLDIEEGGSSTVVIADEECKAQKAAIDLAERLHALRREFHSSVYSIDEVLDLVQRDISGKPAILVDSADSCNAGACGDSMAVAQRILYRNQGLRAAVVVNDAAAAEQAFQMGVGYSGPFRIGGSKDVSAVVIEADGYVKSLHDGVFLQEGPAGRGMHNQIGKTAVIQIGTMDVVVCSYMAGNGDPQLYRAFGVEPSFYQLIVVKACTSFRASYSSFCGTIYETDTPGAAPSNLQRLPYKKLPKYFYPWNSLDDYKVNEIQMGRNSNKKIAK